MDIHELLDAVFYKDDKNTGERKVSCCKLLIVVVVIFIFLGIIGSIVNPDAGSHSNNKESTGNDSFNSTESMMEVLDIEPFKKDTVVDVYGVNFLIPEGYGEDKGARIVETSADDGLVSHNGLYMYYNGSSYISVSYVAFDTVAMDDGYLVDEGSWETIGGYEGKLVHDDGRCNFNFIKNGNSYTVYADSEADIERVLM